MQYWLLFVLAAAPALFPTLASAAEVTLTPLTGVTAATNGERHACAIAQERVWCWGNNDHGQLGVAPSPGQSIARPLSLPVGPPRAIAAGARHTCAIAGAQVMCWGDNDRAQLGTGDRDQHVGPVAVDDLPPGPEALAAGGDHTCARYVDGALYCWGSNAFGQAGSATEQPHASTPQRVNSLPAVGTVSAGSEHTCAVAEGTVYCWGRGSFGRLGTGDLVTRHVPEPVVDLMDNQVGVAAGPIHSCAWDDQGLVHCWGSNYAAQLGVPIESTPGNRSSIPLRAMLQAPASQVAVAYAQSCALTTGGVQCWGLNIGPAPQPVATDAAPQALADNSSPLCLLTDGQLLCQSLAGRGLPLDALTAAQVESLDEPPRALALGYDFACAVVEAPTFRALCWGSNQHGQLGQQDTAPRVGAVEVPFPDGHPVLQIAAGRDHACATTQPFRDILCWGNNTHGALGDGTTEDRLGPVPALAAGGGRTILGAGHGFTCATDPFGTDTVTCWGQNDVGQTGAPPSDPVLEPFEVTLPGVVIDLTVGDEYACAVVTGEPADERWCWGRIPTDEAEAEVLRVTDELVDYSPRRVAGQPATAGPFAVCSRSDGGIACSGRDYFRPTTFEHRGSWVAQATVSPPVESLVLVIGGRHACATLAGGGVACINLLGRACDYEREVGLIGTPGQGISCESTESTMLPYELDWQAVSLLPAGEPDLLAAGHGYACASYGSATFCWGDVSSELLGTAPIRYEPIEPAPILRRGAVEPALSLPVPIDAALACPGFIVGSVSLTYPEAASEAGDWGMEILLTHGDRRLHGGLNFGGFAAGRQIDPTPGYAAFNIQRPDDQQTRVDLSLASDGTEFDLTVKALEPGGNRRTVYAERLTLPAEPVSRPVLLDEGFHIVAVTPVAATTAPFRISARAMAANGGAGWFSHGAVVGGHLGGNQSGYAGICTDDAQPVSFETQARTQRGASGAGDLRLQVRAGPNRVLLYDSATDGH